MLPRTFERRLLLRQLARGGMGEVFLAATAGIEGAERPCVVKIVRREHAEDSSFLARFLDEARIQAQLGHPGVAQVMEAATDASGKPYVVVEYVEGRHLGDVRSRAVSLGLSMSWPDATAIGIAIGDALAHIHEQTDAAGRPLEIAHRDLSPHNVMVGYGGDVKLIDFGTARGHNRRCRTVAGVVFAKPGYVAPEVANNCPGGPPADLYAFGIILWELLSGQRFLRGDASLHLELVAAGERNPTPVAHLVQGPAAIDDIIARLTAVSPDARYASAREATLDLVDLLKRAPSLVGGQRSVRERVAQLMKRLYPTEPGRSRAEFARLLAQAKLETARPAEQPSPGPAEPEQPPASLPAASADPVAGLLPGTRYRILGELGRGGMGVVHEAYHVDLGRSVALKLLPDHFRTDAELSSRFRTEARAIAKLSHDNLVKLHDFGVMSDGRPFYAMELLQGRTVDAWLACDRVVEWREAVAIGIQVCRALEAAHEAGVVHRDIKPSNLFVTRSGTVKLVDFGVATLIRESEAGPGRTRTAIAGTPEYMAPEQAAGAAADERCDIYALGAVLYEMVTGRLPHVAADHATLLEIKQHCVVEPPSRCAPRLSLPKPFDAVVLKALSRGPKDRYQTARQMRQGLQWALQTVARRRNRRRALGFAAVTAILFGVGAIAMRAGQDADIRARAYASARPLLLKWRGLTRAHVPALGRLPVPAVLEMPRFAAAKNRGEPSPDTTARELAGDVPAAAPAPNAESASPQGSAHEDLDEHAALSAQTSSAPSDELDSAMALTRTPAKAKALARLRDLGRRYPRDARVLRAWSSAALELDAWGEALRAAQRWAAVDDAPQARMELARLQRATGHASEAVATLSSVLGDHPDFEPARRMLATAGLRGRLALKP
ncbi:MAG: protein kinase [Polyangiaceae bacterium]|nr:protein kinase [Polyangiaceae bacterium]